MKPTKFLVKSCLTFLLIIAFATASYSQVPQGFDLYTKVSTIWNSSSIPVCWENASGNFNNEMNWVQDAAFNSWERSSAINFTGWGRCTGNSNGIRIQIDDQGPHTIGLGTELNGVPNGMTLNFTFQSWSQSCQSTRERCIRLIAVHEFGHALGFAHEQNRLDTPTNQPGSTKQFCTQERQGGNGDRVIGAWDLNSVMNYCNPNWNGNGSLSATDIDGVQSLYGVKGEEQYLVGDWNGDRRDNLAVRRRNNVLMDTNFDGQADIQQAYGNGNSEDQYLVGDWDGDGRDNLAVRRGNKVLMDFNFDGAHDREQAYGNGNSEDQYLVGDWDGDGKDNLAVRRGNCVLMDFNFDGAHDQKQCYGNGSSENQYLVGDWDGDGRDNLAVRRGNKVLMDFNFDGAHDLEQAYGNG
jgi:hypothetical protein